MDLATDESKIGQWITVDIKPERSQLSPDGRLMATYALDYRSGDEEERGPYVIVSRPPFFTALALWWAGGMHMGGVRWRGDDEILIDRAKRTPPDKGSVPPQLSRP